MNAQQRLDLKDMRVVAETRDQQQLQFLVKRLLQGLDFYVALAVPLERIHAFLDIFESYYPDETWVRKLIIAIATFGTTPDENITAMAIQQNFSAPGSANFLKAVYDVAQSMQSKHTPEARVGFIASAVVNIIMAELVEAWYGERDDLWQIVRLNNYEDEATAEIAYQFWTDAQTEALDRANWLEVADSIEKKLRRLESTQS